MYKILYNKIISIENNEVKIKKYIYLFLLPLLVTILETIGVPNDKDRTQKPVLISKISPKKETAKAAAALVGSAFLGYAALLTPLVAKKLKKRKTISWCLAPSYYLIGSCAIADNCIDPLLKAVLPLNSGEEVSNFIGYNLPYAAALITGILSAYLAKYGINKYRILKKNSRTKSRPTASLK